MPEITYRIWFEPKDGNGYELPDTRWIFPSRSSADVAVGVLNQTDNPAWHGKFSVIEHVDGRPGT